MDGSSRDVTPHPQTSSATRAWLRPAVKIVLLVLPFPFSLPAPLGSFPSPCKHRGPGSRAAQSSHVGPLICCQPGSKVQPLCGTGNVGFGTQVLNPAADLSGVSRWRCQQPRPFLPLLRASKFSHSSVVANATRKPNCAQQQTKMQLIVTDKRTVFSNIRKLERFYRAPLKRNIFTRK